MTTSKRADELLDRLTSGAPLTAPDLVDLYILLDQAMHIAAQLGRRGDVLRHWAGSFLYRAEGFMRHRKIKVLDHYGLKKYRWKTDPEEKRFAEAWANLTLRDPSRPNEHFIDRLLAEDPNSSHVPRASTRDRMVGATVIQWLGSPIGQGFLRDLGYEKVEK